MDKLIAKLIGALFALSMLASPAVMADTNPFGMDKAETATLMMASGKCGEGKCGGESKSKCGEGKCGDGKKSGKCGEGKCGGESKGKGKCGEGKCGGESKSKSKCGEGKCGGN